MSAAVEHQDAMGGADLQIWNNAAYDDGGDSGGSAILKKPSSPAAWYPLRRPIPAVRPSEGHFHAADKENQGVGLPRSPPAPKKTPAAVGKSFPLTPVPAKQPASARKTLGFGGDDGGGADDGDIDAEIKEVEREIGRLTSRLEALRLQKAEKDSRAAGRRGRIVPAKFLEPKTSSDKNDQVEVPALKRVLESPASARYGRRGASLGPLEIISAGVGLRQPLGTPGRTPVRSMNKDRRKSCVFKLQGVAEENGEGENTEKEMPLCPKQRTPAMKSEAAASPSVGFRRGASLGPSEIAAAVGSRRPGKKLHEIKAAAADTKKGGGRSLSSSPKSRQTAAKLPELRKGIATVESKKPARRENPAPPAPKNLRPKTLFQEARKQPAKAPDHSNTAPKSLHQHGTPSQQEPKKPAASIKKPGKNAKMRTVASRYSLITVRVGRNPQEGKRRKWSLPDSGKDDDEGAAATDPKKKSRMSFPAASGGQLAMGSQWEIPDQIDEESADPIEQSPPSLMRIARQLPKIRTIRCDDAWSPRDSGRAKRVAELVGRENSHFDAAVEITEAGTAAAASCESMDVGEDDENSS